MVTFALVMTVLTALPPGIDAQLKAAHTKMLHSSPKVQLAGAKLLNAAYEAAPEHLETMAGASHAWFIRAYWTRDSKKAVTHARRGLKLAQDLIIAHPDRAEGHYWAAANAGLVARAGGVAIAIKEGLAQQIESYAVAALKRDPKLYKGAIPRLLGRYYQELPWPLGNPKKARRLLEEAHKQDPQHISTLLWLAEALIKAGDDERATKLLHRCAKGRGPDRKARQQCKERLGL